MLRWLAPIWPVVAALGFAVVALWAWLQGVRLFGVALDPPRNPEDWTKVLGFAFGVPAGVLALVTFVRSVHEQQSANLWKRREYLAARFDRLEASPSCRAVMRVLDYNATYVDLEGLKGVAIKDAMVMSALAPRAQRGAYTREEQLLRDAFDAFFGELDRIGAMAGAGLFDRRDLQPFAGYWLKLFDPAQRGRPPAYGAVLRRYVRVFHFDALGELLEAEGLMARKGEGAKAQALEDDALIRAVDPAWVAPGGRDQASVDDLLEASAVALAGLAAGVLAPRKP